MFRHIRRPRHDIGPNCDQLNQMPRRLELAQEFLQFIISIPSSRNIISRRSTSSIHRIYRISLSHLLQVYPNEPVFRIAFPIFILSPRTDATKTHPLIYSSLPFYRGRNLLDSRSFVPSHIQLQDYLQMKMLALRSGKRPPA